MEERAGNTLALQGDLHVVDDVGEGGTAQHGAPLALFGGGLPGALHQRGDALVFKGGDLYDGDAELPLELDCVQLVSALFDGVHHIERDDDGYVDLHDLCGEVEVALEVGRIDDVDDAVRLFVDDVVAGDDLLGGIRRKGIDTGEVDDGDRLGQLFVGALLFIHRNARPVADVRRAAREGVEQRRLAAVGVACKGKFQHFTLPP